MRRICILAAAIAVMGTGVLAGDGDDPSKADLKKLQGKWRMVVRKLDGMTLKPLGVWTFAGDKIPSGAGLYAKVKLNAKASPKEFDQDLYDARNMLRPGDSGLKGIYAFDGDNRLKWCVTAINGRPRPKVFGSKSGDGNIYYELERVKD